MKKTVRPLIRPLEKYKLRGEDPTGNGWYGASRGSREHEGVDYLGNAGDPVFAVCGGVVRLGQVYMSASKSHFKLVEITGSEYRAKQMYVTPCVENGDRVYRGTLIGHLQGIGDFYGDGMPNHCHVGVWKNGLLTDPEPIIG